MNSERINIWRLCKYFTLALALHFVCVQQGAAQLYPVHAAVQWPTPQSPYLSDYYTGSRERLIVTLLNRDLQQPLLYAKLRIKIKSTGFLATTREEYDYPVLELHSNVPTRLTNIDLTPYLQPTHLQMNGSLRNGQLPTGYTELAVQVIDYYTGRALSAWHTGRAYLDVKKPPLLNFPEKDAQVGIRDPLYIRFGWTPRHQGLAGTEYEFVIKELPDNGAAPQSAFAYGNEIYRIRTRNTSVNYTHLEPILSPGRRYGWQVQAIARDGIDEVGLFENGGFSEISWFYLSDNCLAPTGLKADSRFARVDLSWDKVTGTTGYVVECRPKTKLNVYEWSNVRVAGESLTLGRLNPGWTYEWRVGTLCTEDRPVFSDVKEFTLSKYNDELLADCGKEPVRSDLSQEPNLRIKAGDVVIIGGDYPMTITEATSLGDGWYAGRGKTRLKTIIDAPVALRFDRLRINVDNFQIDGTVEASYDEQKGKIGNLDYIDDGGKDIQPSTLRIREHKLDFTLPDIPQIALNPGTGELELTDADGNPRTIQIDIPENASYESIFPMIVTDDKGNSYQLTPAEQHTDAEDNADQQGKVPLQADRVDRVGDFNTEALSDRYGHVRFERGEGRYAFDAGTDDWYKKSVKLDRFYKPFAKGYIAPWKLVPVGESDVVTARYDGRKDIDLRKVRFVSEPNAAALPAQLSEAEQTWTVSLRSVAENSTYDVFAVYEGEVIGKLRVVSYAMQQHRVTLVPINGARLDRAAIEQELNAIYNPVGVRFTVEVDERMRGNYDWEATSEKDGLLGLAGTSFWGYDRELKESAEMVNLQRLYQQQAGTLSGAYLFVLDGAKGLEGRKDGLLGEMPRKNRFGYIFAGNSPNTASLSYTIAHELGHGLFTLQHTFDHEYGGRKSEGTTANLMDYAGGTELAAFQWNIMASPAVFTAADKAEEGKIKLKSGEYLGFTPDGRIIQARPEDYAGFFDIENSYFIAGFKDNKGNTYKWNGENYINENGDIFYVSDTPITGKVAIWTKSKHPDCYVWYKFIEVKDYTSKDFESIKRLITSDVRNGWQPDLVKNASADCLAKAQKEDENFKSALSKVHFTAKASNMQMQILSEIAEFLAGRRTNTLTTKELSKDFSIIVSIEGDNTRELDSLKNQSRNYIHIIFSDTEGSLSISNITSSSKDESTLLNVWDLIKMEPWASQAIILYELADLLSNGIEYLKIPETVWNCAGEQTIYKKVVSYLLEVQIPILTANNFLDNKLTPESKFAFVCGLWNGTVDIVQSVPELAKLLTCVFHSDCSNNTYSQWESFKGAVVEDEAGNILCQQDEYLCKARQMVSVALEELVADDCKLAHTVGSVVGPIAVMCLGDVAAGEAVLTRLGKVGSGLKYAIKGLQLCDKVTDITRPLTQGLKVSTALIKKGGKLLPEIRIDGNTLLHYIDDKLHIRKWDVGSNNVVDEPIADSELSQKVKEVLERGKDAASVGRYSLANISKERGFIDLLPDLLKKEGLTMDDFHYMMQKNVNALTEAEKAQLARIRNAMPKPDANTVMQKVIPADDIELYILGDYSGVRGSVSVASDTKHLKTFEDYYHGLRLDYEGTKFHLSKNSCGVIRFKSKRIANNISIPTAGKWSYPFTAHGFTSGNNGRLGVPEWNFIEEVKFEEGFEIWEVFNDGTEKLRAIYNAGKFNSLK